MNYSNEKICNEKGYLKIKYTLKISNNYLNIVDKISSGDIILIPQNIKPEYLKVLLNETIKNDLEPIYINELISENI